MAVNTRQLDRILSANGFEISMTVPDNHRALYCFRKGKDGRKAKRSMKQMGIIPRTLYNHILESAPHAAYAAKELLSHFNVSLDVNLPEVGGELQVRLAPEYKAELVEDGVDVEALTEGRAQPDPIPEVVPQSVFDAEPEAAQPVDVGLGEVPEELFEPDPLVLAPHSEIVEALEEPSLASAPAGGPETVTFKDKEGNMVTGEIKSGGSTMSPADLPARKAKAEDFFSKHGG